jgi:HPt (histidine-containing phosphotransfer) domain-containing protein
MTQRLSEYLTQETREYLEQLDRLLAPPAVPDPEELLRLARGVRGSAQMAGIETLARVAERLEDAARAVLSRSLVWSEEIRRLAIDTVRDLQILVRALNRWGPEEEARVRAAIHRWDDREAETEGAEVVPIISLFPDDPGPHVLSVPPGVEEGVVPIQALLVRPDDALHDALALRPEIERCLSQGDQPGLRARITELFDLLQAAATTDSGPPA